MKCNRPQLQIVESRESRGLRHLTGHLCAWLLRDIAHIGLINNIKPVSCTAPRCSHRGVELGVRVPYFLDSVPNCLHPLYRHRRSIWMAGCGLGIRFFFSVSFNWFLFVLAHWQAFKSFNIPIITSRVVNINLQWTQSQLKWFLALSLGLVCPAGDNTRERGITNLAKRKIDLFKPNKVDKDDISWWTNSDRSYTLHKV